MTSICSRKFQSVICGPNVRDLIVHRHKTISVGVPKVVELCRNDGFDIVREWFVFLEEFDFVDVAKVALSEEFADFEVGPSETRRLRVPLGYSLHKSILSGR